MHRAAAVLSIVTTTAAAQVGALTPPPGPVQESGRFGNRTELSQTNTPGDSNSVFKITQPGHYVLTSNLDVVGDTTGIEIASDHVFIDLNGRVIRGTGDGSGAGIAIRNGTSGFEGESYRNLGIRNGSIADLGTGIRLGRLIFGALVFTVNGVTIDSVTVSSCDIGATLLDATISNSTVIANRLALDVYDSTVSSCVVELRGTDDTVGALNATDSAIRGSRISLVTSGFGDYALQATGSSVEGCTIEAAESDAVPALLDGSVARGCRVIGPGLGSSSALIMLNGSIASNCLISDAQFGFTAADSSAMLVESCGVIRVNIPVAGSFTSRNNAGF
ncbi:MAG: hypothetical protein AAFR38_09700 [Planctomycetota bacterium]